MKHRNEIVTCAMLFDLDRFLGTASEQFAKRYQDLLGRYVDVRIIRAILKHKTQYEPIHEILREARKISLGLKKGGMNKGKKCNALTSIFSGLIVNGKQPERLEYHLSRLGEADISPYFHVNMRVKDYEKLAAEFYEQMDCLAVNPPDNWEGFLIVFETILSQFLWCVPASGRLHEDIALYDHIRMMTALTAAICDQEDNSKKFAVVSGRITGIEEYIFSISDEDTNAAEKKLKARSFYISCLAEAAAHNITDLFQVPKINIIVLTSGKFYIILPNLKQTGRILRELDYHLSAYMFDKFKGQLSIDLAWEKAKAEDLYEFTEIVRHLEQILERKEIQPFLPILSAERKWREDAFILYDDIYNHKMCASCGQALTAADKKRCPLCERDSTIGNILPHIKKYYYTKAEGEFELLPGYYLNLSDKYFTETYLCNLLNVQELPFELSHKPITIKYSANNTPLGQDGQVKSFTGLAREAAGIDRIGVFKADVDILGYLFMNGWSKSGMKTGTISRIGTMSRMLEVFFQKILHDVIKQKYKNVYSLLAGDGNLFFIGPWDIMVDLASQVQERFWEFTARNSSLSLSAALTFERGDVPVSLLAERVQTGIQQVKDPWNSSIYPYRESRNGIFYLGEILSWGDFRRQMKTAEKITAAEVEPALLRRLKQYSQMYRQYLTDGDAKALMFQPLIHYDKRKNYHRFRDNHYHWFRNYSDMLYEKALQYQEIQKDLYFADICITYALMKNKEGIADDR